MGFSTLYKVTDQFLPMLGFEPRISGVGSNHSANCATTTAQGLFLFKERQLAQERGNLGKKQTPSNRLSFK